MRALVTGATGFVGGHIVEALAGAGHVVRALVRPTSDRTHLERLGVELAYGDVTRPDSLRRALSGVDAVFHTAALVSAYGRWEPYQRVGVEGTRNVVEAAAELGVERFIHLSSIAVYGFIHTSGRPIDESAPYDESPESWNHYVREKVLSEKVVWEAHDAGRIRATALRPSVVLGARDRNVVTRFMALGPLPVRATIGLGSNRVPCVVVDELADAAVRAATLDVAVGKAYNLSGQRPITQAELLRAFGRAAGCFVLPTWAPTRAVLGAAGLLEAAYRLAGREEEPFLSRLAVAIFGHDYEIDCSRAARELGWEGSADYVDAVRASVTWYREVG